MAAGASSRYETLLRLASGGMATVWIGAVRGALGFRQLVAIKKPHPHLLEDASFRAELVAEARLASMIHHANVVDVRDVEIDGASISLVMDYIEGASLGELLVAANRKGTRLSPRVCVRIVLDALAGLHAAHELVDERGRPTALVHRDVSPQNILVGTDGTARVADFGVAKFARKNMQSTSEGSLKGKLAYMAPEYLRGETIDRRFDVFAAGVVLWEALTGRRLFRGENEAETLKRVLDLAPEPVSRIVPEAAAIDDVVATALAKARDERFQNAAAMAAALEGSALSAKLLAGHFEVAEALKELVGAAIEERRKLVRAKLANEPSVASLMGVPPILKPDAVPATMVDAPADTKQESTPKMGGADPPPTKIAVTSPQPSTESGPFAPATVPMTAPGATVTSPGASPRIITLESPARAAPAPAPANATLASATPLGAPPAQTTLRSDEPMPHPPPPEPMRAGSTLRSEDAVAPAIAPEALAFHDASGRSVSGTVAPGVPSRRPAWIFVVAGVGALAVAAVVAGVFVLGRAKPPPAPTVEAPPTSNIQVDLGNGSITIGGSASPSITLSSAPLASTSTAPPPVTATARPKTPPHPSAPPPPSVHKPPPNPYGAVDTR
jgi:serine/threonine-protein kinase